MAAANHKEGPCRRYLQVPAWIWWLAFGVAALNIPAFAAESEAAADQAEDRVENQVEDKSATESELSIEERLDALLTEALPEDQYREVSQCLWQHQYRQVEVLDNQHLLFRKSSRFWLNELKMPCPGLNRNLVLTFESRGTSSLCNGEHVYLTSRFDLDRGFDPMGRPIGLEGVCTLGSFQVITAEQAAILRGVKR
jgi:hypothetical protein